MHPTAVVKAWRALGLDLAQLQSANLIYQGHGNDLYRLRWGDRTYILKHFPPGSDAHEVQVYRLFEEGGVPTLPVYRSSERAILLEDLTASTSWRLAWEEDMSRAEMGAAVGRWYRQLHDFGRALLQQAPARAASLVGEYDTLDAVGIRKAADRLGLSALDVWELAVEALPRLKVALERFPQTICYNDFYWTNLALSRGTAPKEAIVFDYHLVGRGIAYSDCRNVAGSLGPEARRAFSAVYGPVDEREAVIDAPLAILYGLAEAAKRPRLPRWAAPLIEQAQDGHLAQCLREALREVD